MVGYHWVVPFDFGVLGRSDFGGIGCIQISRTKFHCKGGSM